MFYIQAMLCLLHIQNMPVPVCFTDATIPYSYQTKEECILKRDELVLIINDDLKKRKISMILFCNEYEQLGDITNV